MRALALLGLLWACEAEPDQVVESLVEPVVDEAEPAPPVEAGHPLEDGRYRFCEVPGSSYREVRAWCELLEDAPPERCPGMRETCDGYEVEEIPSGCGQPMDGHVPDQVPGFGEPPEPEEVYTVPEGCIEPNGCAEGCGAEGCGPNGGCEAAAAGCPAAGFMASAMRWVAAIFVALLLLVAIRLIARYLGTSRGPRPPSSETGAEVDLALADDDLPDMPGEDILARARAALAEGRFSDAILLARAAALRRLGERGKLRLHRSRTDREYARALRRHGDLHGPMRDLVRLVELLRWGGRAPGEDLARRAVGLAERLVAALLLALLLGAPASAWGSGERYGPYGDAALPDVLEVLDWEVRWRARPLEELPDEGPGFTLVLDAWAAHPTDQEWEAVRTWVEQGGALLVAGGPIEVFPELGTWHDDIFKGPFLQRERLAVPRLPGGFEGKWALDPEASDRPTWQMGRALLHGQPAEGPDTEGPRRVVAQKVWVGQGAVLAVSDARILRNAAFVREQNTEVVAEMGSMLRRDLPPDGHVELATRRVRPVDTPFDALRESRMLPFMLHLLLVMVLLVLWRAWPLLPLRDPPPADRMAFVDHIQALGAHYARLGATRRAASGVARLALARLGSSGLELAAVQAGRSRQAAAELVERARDMVEEPNGPDQEDDLEIMEELWKIIRKR